MQTTEVKPLIQKQQTGFRADRDLLNRFRSKLALEDREMGETIEELIEAYVSGFAARTIDAKTEKPGSLAHIQLRNGTKNESWTFEDREVLTLLRAGGERAVLVRKMTSALLRLNALEAASDDGTARLKTGAKNPYPKDRAGFVVTDQRIAKAELMAKELNAEERESPGVAARHAANGHGLGRRGKRVGSRG